jgi:hypothetical protein
MLTIEVVMVSLEHLLDVMNRMTAIAIHRTMPIKKIIKLDLSDMVDRMDILLIY